MLWVICLCAQWCDVCRQYRPAFESLSTNWPKIRFAWVDVEDEESVVGDVEVETFPTLLIGNIQGNVRFFGPLLPQAQVLQRLLKDPVIQECRLRKFMEDIETDDIVTNIQTKIKVPHVC